MRTSRHFELKVRDQHPEITIEMCAYAVSHAEAVEQQGNGFYRMWAYIPEAGKYLRVITEGDRVTLHNAFFDSGYAKRKRSY